VKFKFDSFDWLTCQEKRTNQNECLSCFSHARNFNSHYLLVFLSNETWNFVFQVCLVTVGRGKITLMGNSKWAHPYEGVFKNRKIAKISPLQLLLFRAASGFFLKFHFIWEDFPSILLKFFLEQLTLYSFYSLSLVVPLTNDQNTRSVAFQSRKSCLSQKSVLRSTRSVFNYFL
jgi:hypothetical protein